MGQQDSGKPNDDAARPDAGKPAAEGRDSCATEPDAASVRDYLVYGLSLPERTLRSTAAIVGGVLNESAALLVPQAFRSSKTYGIFVQQMLNLLVQDLGKVRTGAEKARPVSPEVESYVARKAVGSFIDLAGTAVFHVSPLTVLAIVSDVAYGSQTYLDEVSHELKQRGVIDQDTTVDHASDLLEAIGQAANRTATAVDSPPLSVEGLRQTIEQTQEAVSQLDPTALIPEAEVQRLWDDMHQMATRENVSVTDVSSAMTLYSLDKVATLGKGTLTSVGVAGNMFDDHILDHYRDALQDIGTKGIYGSLADSSQPYVNAVWEHYAGGTSTFTEDVLTGRAAERAWDSVRQWLGNTPPAPQRDEQATDGNG